MHVNECNCSKVIKFSKDKEQLFVSLILSTSITSNKEKSIF